MRAGDVGLSRQRGGLAGGLGCRTHDRVTLGVPPSGPSLLVMSHSRLRTLRRLLRRAGIRASIGTNTAGSVILHLASARRLAWIATPENLVMGPLTAVDLTLQRSVRVDRAAGSPEAWARAAGWGGEVSADAQLRDEFARETSVAAAIREVFGPAYTTALAELGLT